MGEANIDWAGSTAPGRVGQAWSTFKSCKSAYTHIKNVAGMANEDTRWGSAAKEVIKLTMDLAQRVLGRSLTSHPYFAYHKAHIELLANVINISIMQTSAAEDWEKASAAATHAQELTRECEIYDSRKSALGVSFGFGLLGSLALLRDYRIDPGKAKAQMAAAGSTPEAFQSRTDDRVAEWRNDWIELAADSLELFLMMQVQFRGVEVAMASYKRRRDKLQASGGLAAVAGRRLEDDEVYRQLDLTRAQLDWGTSKTQRAALAAKADPLGVARRSLDLADKTAYRISRCADVAQGEDVYSRPEQAMQQLSAALN